MRRIDTTPRANWPQRVEYGGNHPRWNESAYYEFTPRDIEILATAANELEKMALDAARHIIANRLYARMCIPENAVPLIESSWEAQAPSLCGRLDLAWDGTNPPKLLEYEADTPASLAEAAVLQRRWLQETFPGRGQFNWIHERLVARWKELAPCLPAGRIDFCSIDDAEDAMTVAYLEGTAKEAGLEASSFHIGEIGWNGAAFVGPDGRPLGAVFKLYPWEWMVREAFGRHLAAAGTLWIEPPWKMLLSNKGLPAVLWELFPRHPNLLEASLDRPGLMMSWVRKPLLGREGANILLHQPGRDFETGGASGEEGFVWQDLAPIRGFGGVYPVIGSWLIGHKEGNAAAGLGVRESDAPIAANPGIFVPHIAG